MYFLPHTLRRHFLAVLASAYMLLLSHIYNKLVIIRTFPSLCICMNCFVVTGYSELEIHGWEWKQFYSCCQLLIYGGVRLVTEYVASTESLTMHLFLT